MKKYILTAAAAVLFSGLVSAQQTAGPAEGGISPEMLARISASYEDNAYDKAISNALAGVNIATLAVNADNAAMIDTHFSDSLPTAILFVWKLPLPRNLKRLQSASMIAWKIRVNLRDQESTRFPKS